MVTTGYSQRLEPEAEEAKREREEHVRLQIVLKLIGEGVTDTNMIISSAQQITEFVIGTK